MNCVRWLSVDVFGFIVFVDGSVSSHSIMVFETV